MESSKLSVTESGFTTNDRDMIQARSCLVYKQSNTSHGSPTEMTYKASLFAIFLLICSSSSSGESEEPEISEANVLFGNGVKAGAEISFKLDAYL